MDINTLPRLQKTIQFDPRFETDWQFGLVKKLFLAMGDDRFTKFINAWIWLIDDSLWKLDDATLWKFKHLMPRANPNATNYTQDAITLVRILTYYAQDNHSDGIVANTRKILYGEALIAFNEIQETDANYPAVSQADIKTTRDVFIDMVHFFYMLQSIEILSFAPGEITMPPKVFKNGKFDFDYSMTRPTIEDLI